MSVGIASLRALARNLVGGFVSVVALLIVLVPGAQAAPSWQPPKFLSASGTAESSVHGRLGFDGAGNTYAAWEVPANDAFASGIRFAALDRDTDTWDSPQVV